MDVEPYNDKHDHERIMWKIRQEYGVPMIEQRRVPIVVACCLNCGDELPWQEFLFCSDGCYHALQFRIDTGVDDI